jgi:hypothetical protein
MRTIAVAIAAGENLDYLARERGLCRRATRLPFWRRVWHWLRGWSTVELESDSSLRARVREAWSVQP